MIDEHRATAIEIANKHLSVGDPLGWFEDLYSQAGENISIIPWADLMTPIYSGNIAIPVEPGPSV